MMFSGWLLLSILFCIMLVDLQGYLLHSKSVVKSPSQGRIQSYHASLPINHKTKRVLKSLSIQDVNESPGDKTSKDSDLPTRKELFLFAVPTLAIWLLQPILSLIDTAVLGMSKSTSIYEVAALGPGISWIDSSSYLFYFLGIVTTNLFAAALRDNDPKERHNVLVNTLQLALLFGFVLFALQFFGASFMVRQLSGASIQSVPFGTDYAKIRAVAAPFALLSFVAQSAFLASKDAMTPLHAVLIGSLVNLFGDLLLVQGFHYGIRGAAVATALSQVCSTVYLWYRAVKSASKPVSASITGRIFQAPHWTEMRRVLSLCGPLCAVLFIKTCHWSLSTFAASSAGVYSLAAHQVVINCFFFFCIFGDVVGQVVQSYATYTLPTPSNHDISESSNSSIDGSISHNTGTLSVEENGTKNRNDVSQRLVGQLTTQGAQLVEAMSQVAKVIGSANGLLGYALCRWAGRWFSRSAEVQAQIAASAGMLLLSAWPHSLVMVHETTLLLCRDLSFLTTSYVLSGVLLLVYQLLVYRRQLGVAFVWLGMASYQWLRLLVFQARREYLQRHMVTKDK